MQPKVKICGIRNQASALAAYKAGADFIGLNFVASSSRKITPLQAQKIVKSLPKKRQLKIVGIFQNQKLTLIKKLVKTVPLDYVQLHGSESPAFCKKINAPVIKAFGLKSDFGISKTLSMLNKYKIKICLIDRLKRGQGAPLNLSKVKILSKDFPIMLAGGMRAQNLKQAIKTQPYAIDVASGVETDGKTDIQKVAAFIKIAKRS